MHNLNHQCCEDKHMYDSSLSVKMTGRGDHAEGRGGDYDEAGGGEEKMHVSSDSDYFSFTAQADI